MKNSSTERAGWVVGGVVTLLLGLVSFEGCRMKSAVSDATPGPRARPYFPAPQRTYEVPGEPDPLFDPAGR
jgi:hypothetical protein